ncbi:hypothetical protein A3L04_10520 [Thermococcus chitonophagus]|uniref:Uncharacterized protein n=1 Tax=Thermococcus chitonophagus TaxID=54262 RepID=A0A2Z2NAZ2_9EURY|nr:hypothetical protein [Thermococcus chitonophagus]ASJ17470.1 hypothetical protein A3L04_10520 [Thermococcus chitonophagus]
MIRKIFGLVLIVLALTLPTFSTFSYYRAQRKVTIEIGNDPMIKVDCLGNGSIKVTNNMDTIVHLQVTCKHCKTEIETLYPGENITIEHCHKYLVVASWENGGATIRGHCCCCPHNKRRCRN